jgi:lipopolysaccharide export system protein LptC
MASRRTASEAVVQELGPAPSRSRTEWATQRRASATEVRRYSRFVVIMKRILPLAAAALLAAVVAYSLQSRQPDQAKLTLTFAQLGIVNNDLAMVKPRLTGVDGSGNPFVVTADKAVQYAHDPNRALLDNVEADLTLRDGNWLNATAPQGLLDAPHAANQKCAKTTCPANQLLDMWGPIAVFSDNGYEIHTTFAHVDMGRGIVRGSKFVRGQGPMGTFYADSFVFKFHGHVPPPPGGKSAKPAGSLVNAEKKIFLYGNVHMTIYGHGMSQS